MSTREFKTRLTYEIERVKSSLKFDKFSLKQKQVIIGYLRILESYK
jgi:hypothetical protein